jgi:hypothetical protein
MSNRIPVFVKWLKGYIPLLLSTLVLLSAVRLMWFISYSDFPLETKNFDDISSAFILGLRFDLSDFCYFSIPGFLLTIIWLFLGTKKVPKNLFKFIYGFLTLFSSSLSP